VRLSRANLFTRKRVNGIAFHEDAVEIATEVIEMCVKVVDHLTVWLAGSSGGL
jgi:hypothetical protein